MPLPRLKMVPVEAIVLDTEESQEIHRILDWLASQKDEGQQCISCSLVMGHDPNCFVIRAYQLIETWSKS